MSFHWLNVSWTRGFELVTRGFQLVTSGFELITRGFELVTRGFKLVTRGLELVTHGFELVPREFEIVTREVELATYEFEHALLSFHSAFKFSTLNSCFTLSHLRCFARFSIIYKILKNVKNIHGGVLLLVKSCGLQPLTFLKGRILHRCFSFFAIFKFYKWYQIVQRVSSLSLFQFCIDLNLLKGYSITKQ